MRWWKATLAELSGGNGWRAALILVVAHIAPAVILVGLWVVGLLSIFDDGRWLLVTLAVVFAMVCFVGSFVRFGFWGTPSTFGQGGGEDFQATFSPGVGFGLGWLRWFLQVFAAFALFASTLLVVGNVQWWHFVGTPELDSLPARVATMPIPGDWNLESKNASATGFPAFMDGPDGPEPEGFIEQSFSVPESFGFDDLKAWLTGPEWANRPGGASFGAIQRTRCDTDSSRCKANLVPPKGKEPEFFISATLDAVSAPGKGNEVHVRLVYRQFTPPDFEVSDATVDRANQLPIPSDWTRYSVVEGSTANGESFTQFFEVPDDFGQDDLEAWFTGSVWTTGPNPFGALVIDDEPCWDAGLGPDNPKRLCSAIVEGTQRDPRSGPPWSGPIESVRVSLDADHSVQLNVSRNG